MAILTSRASAVVLLSSPGVANNGQNSLAGPPTAATYYESVGVRGTGGASVVYLGNGWALTADHVAVNSAGGTPQTNPDGFVDLYNTSTASYEYFQVGSTTQIFNTDQTPTTPSNLIGNPNLQNTPTDLQLIHLSPNADLSTVQAATLATSNPSNTNPVTMIGAGQDLGAQWTYTYDSFNYTAYGLTGSENVPRWGTNDIATVVNFPLTVTNSVNSTDDYTFSTTFGNPSGNSQGAQATTGDSGGGVFDASGKLVGLIADLSGFPPSLSSQNPTGFDYTNNVFIGEQTTIIDLYYYAYTINADIAAVPEPSSLVLGGLGAGIVLLAGLRARRKRLARLSLTLALN